MLGFIPNKSIMTNKSALHQHINENREEEKVDQSIIFLDVAEVLFKARQKDMLKCQFKRGQNRLWEFSNSLKAGFFSFCLVRLKRAAYPK